MKKGFTADKDGFVIVQGILVAHIGSNPDVVLPKGLTSIEDRVFYECKALAQDTSADTSGWYFDEALTQRARLTKNSNA